MPEPQLTESHLGIVESGTHQCVGIKHHGGVGAVGYLVYEQVVIAVMQRKRTGESFHIEKQLFPVGEIETASPVRMFPQSRS